MPKFYSQDFRQKVIEAIELNGHKKGEASELFNISRNTIDLWLKLKAQTGSLQPKPRQSRGSHHKITDWEKFRDFAQVHGDKTQEQMAQLWDDQISSRTIARALHKIGFTRKKRPMATKNATKLSVQHFWSN
jgi:transposase